MIKENTGERMSTPENKAELLQAITTGRSELEAALAQVNEADMRQTGVEGTWSVRDIVAHICAYEQYMAAMLADMKQPQGQETAMLDSYYQTNLTMYRNQHPELPEKLEEVRGDQINAVFTAAYQYKRAGEVLAMERQAYQKLLDWVEQFSEEELRKPFAPNGATLLQVLARQTYEHYQKHVPVIRAWVEQKGG